MVQPEVIAARRGNVIRLRGMCQAIVFGEEDAFFREVCDAGILLDSIEIL